MTLDEAIRHCEEVADTCEYEASKYDMTDAYEKQVACEEGRCADEHRQLAEWLKDYKRLLEREPVLGKIRTEIEQGIAETNNLLKDGHDERVFGFVCGYEEVLKIIDKYTESEAAE